MRTILLIILTAITVAATAHAAGKEVQKMAEIRITSAAFEHEGKIPPKYTCDGADVNPPLGVAGTPPGAKSLALIMDDPDAPAGTWVHWVVWNIDPGISAINENAVPKGGAEGMNDFRKHSYGGPCPPSGTHRYFFKLYALDTTLTLGANSDKAALEKAMKGHIIGQGQLMGLYKRK